MSELPECPQCGPPDCPLSTYADRIEELEAENKQLKAVVDAAAAYIILPLSDNADRYYKALNALEDK